MTQAKAKANSTLTTAWEGSVLSIMVLGAGEVKFDLERASRGNREWAEKHGWTQRLCDRAAIAAPVRSPGMTEHEWIAALRAHKAAKYEAIRELAEYYMSGDVPWKMVGGGQSESGLLFTALARLRPALSSEQITKFLESRTKEQMAVIRARQDVIEMMNQIRLERAPKVDASGALDELDAMGDIDSEIESELGQ